jgi:hypothetical protein
MACRKGFQSDLETQNRRPTAAASNLPYECTARLSALSLQFGMFSFQLSMAGWGLAVTIVQLGMATWRFRLAGARDVMSTLPPEIR